MDSHVEMISLQLADTAARNTTAYLLSDKNELLRIAQAYEEELIAQKISEKDIEYISTQFVPVLQKFVESAAASEGQDVTEAQRVLELVQPLLSVEMVTVLQLIGFNFRKAIGEPLTELISRMILSKTQNDSSQLLDVQRVNAIRDNTFLEIARDPEAYDRLAKMQAQRAEPEPDS